MTRRTITLCLLFICLCLCGCEEAPPAPEPIVFANSGAELAGSTREIRFPVEAGETAMLSRLTELEYADLSGSLCLDEICRWSAENPQVKVKYTVTLPDGTVLDNSAQSVDLSAMSGEEVLAAADSIRYLPELRLVKLGQERQGLDWDVIPLLQAASRDAKIKYSFSLYGKEFELENTQINLSHIPVDDGGAAVVKAMAHMPNLTYLDMDSCGLSNEEMAAIRDAYPHVKVVWRVWFGDRGNYSVRTDTERILASKSSVGGLVYGEYAEPLKYCTDVKYLDLGHNALMDDISFVSYMPKLEVAILAMGRWSDASPLADCPELEYIEMQTTNCTDLSPLAELKKLRHLNVACIPGLSDISPLYGLTELERLWLGSNNRVPWEQVEKMEQFAPDCEIDTLVFKDPTAGRWRYTADGTWNYRYYVLRKQFGNYESKAFSFTWNDPLYEAKADN